jgi:PAS domain S-box-containing protein
MSFQIDVEKVLLRELMEDAPDYIFIKDRQSRFVMTNKAHAQLLLGLKDPLEALGKTDFVLFPEQAEDAQRFYAEEQAIMNTGQPVLRREWLVPSTAARANVWLSESKLPIRDEAGEIVGLIGIGRDITLRKNAQLLTEKLTHQLETAVQVARIANDILDPRELTQQIVNLLRDSFNFYYVGLFLIDQTQRLDSNPGEYAVLRAATGDAGQKMLSRGHKLKVAGESLVGQCLATGESLLGSQALNPEGQWLVNPLLPETRTEMVLPLVSRKDVIGALSIHSTSEAAFTEKDFSVFEVLASLLATSIQNAFLFQKLDEDLKTTKRSLQAYTKDGWERYLNGK